MKYDVSQTAATRREQVLSLNLVDLPLLYAAYMPFIKQGGLFIGTDQVFPLDAEVAIILKLLAEPEPILLQGKVVWITPLGAEHKRPPGIGVQLLGDNAQTIRNKIEAYLADFNPPVEGSDTI